MFYDYFKNGSVGIIKVYVEEDVFGVIVPRRQLLDDTHVVLIQSIIDNTSIRVNHSDLFHERLFTN